MDGKAEHRNVQGSAIVSEQWFGLSLGQIMLAAVAGFITLIASIAGTTNSALAMPSFARQTGQACSSCHTVIPELTPFGRRFKLGGYSLDAGEGPPLPVSALFIGSGTHTNKSQSVPPAPGLKTNDNFTVDQMSVFYAGKIYGDLGAFVQATYDGVNDTFALDNTDIRFARNAKFFGKDTVFGLSVNNNPTVQDVWNTTPAWGFPQFSSAVAPQFSPPGAMLEGALAGQVGGVSAYMFIDDSVYVEAGGYFGLSRNLQSALGTLGSGLSGVAPYGRIAVEKTFGDYNVMVGGFGMIADVQPGWITNFGTDRFTDLGLDAQVQYLDDRHSLMFKVSNIFEWMKLHSTFRQGGSTNLNNNLNVFKASATWVYDHKYSLSGSYFNISGSSDAGLYAGGALPGSTMGMGVPDGSGLIFALSYSPFMDGGLKLFPTANVLLGIQYTAYLDLFGRSSNFDGLGNNASDNNTVFLYMVSAF